MHSSGPNNVAPSAPPPPQTGVVPIYMSPSKAAPWWVAPALSIAIVVAGGLIVWGRVDSQVARNTADIAEMQAASAKMASKEELGELRRDVSNQTRLIIQIALALGVKVSLP